MATQTQILKKQENVRRRLDYMYVSLLDKYIDEYRKTHPEPDLDNLASLNDIDMCDSKAVTEAFSQYGMKGLDLYRFSTDDLFNLLANVSNRETRTDIRTNIQNLVVLYQKSGVRLPDYISNDFMKTRMHALHHKAESVLQKRLEKKEADFDKLEKNENDYIEAMSKARDDLAYKKYSKHQIKKIKGIQKSHARLYKAQRGRKGIRELNKQRRQNYATYLKEHLGMSDKQAQAYIDMKQSVKKDHPRLDLIKANKDRGLSNFSTRLKAAFRGLGSGIATVGRGAKHVATGTLKGLKHVALLPVHLYNAIARKSEENMNKGYEALFDDARNRLNNTEQAAKEPVTPTEAGKQTETPEQTPAQPVPTEQEAKKEFQDRLHQLSDPVKPAIPNIIGLSDQQLLTQEGKTLNELYYHYDNAKTPEKADKIRASLETLLTTLVAPLKTEEQKKPLVVRALLDGYKDDLPKRNESLCGIFNAYEAYRAELAKEQGFQDIEPK